MRKIQCPIEYNLVNKIKQANVNQSANCVKKYSIYTSGTKCKNEIKS